MGDYALIKEKDVVALRAEVQRLQALILDACKAFERYDLPEHAFHYRRAVLGLDKAKELARG